MNFSDNVPSRVKDHPAKIPNTRHENSSFDMLVRVAQQSPPKYIIVALDTPLEV